MDHAHPRDRLVGPEPVRVDEVRRDERAGRPEPRGAETRLSSNQKQRARVCLCV